MMSSIQLIPNFFLKTEIKFKWDENTRLLVFVLNFPCLVCRSEFECSVGFSSVLFSFCIIVFLLTLREATLYLSVWENDPVMTQFRTFWTLSRPKLDSTVQPTQWLVAPLPFADWSHLVYTFINLPCTDDDEASHIFKDPKLHKKGSQIFFLLFHNRIQFLFKGMKQQQWPRTQRINPRFFCHHS